MHLEWGCFLLIPIKLRYVPQQTKKSESLKAMHAQKLDLDIF